MQEALTACARDFVPAPRPAAVRRLRRAGRADPPGRPARRLRRREHGAARGARRGGAAGAPGRLRRQRAGPRRPRRGRRRRRPRRPGPARRDAGRSGARACPWAPTRARCSRGWSAGERRAILANVRSSEPDVKGVVGKLVQGAADAGFVYRSDVEASGGELEAIELRRRAQAGGRLRGRRRQGHEGARRRPRPSSTTCARATATTRC